MKRNALSAAIGVGHFSSQQLVTDDVLQMIKTAFALRNRLDWDALCSIRGGRHEFGEF